MNINIDQKAKEYIESKSSDKSINITINKVRSGWCESSEPSVKMGKPYNIDSFHSYEVDDIQVFVQKGIIARHNEINVGINKILIFKSLNVDGIIL